MEIVIASHNRHKKEEIISITGSLGLDIKYHLLDEYPDLEEILEDGKTFEDNAAKKALGVAKYTNKISLADDSGIMVDALNGAPGVLSARFAGDKKDDEANNKLLMQKLTGIPIEKRTAKFVCVIAVADPEKVIKFIRAECCGIIAFEPRGKSGFGYDPLFMYPQFDKTFAEMDSTEKNMISHRAGALKGLQEFLQSL